MVEKGESELGWSQSEKTDRRQVNRRSSRNNRNTHLLDETRICASIDDVHIERVVEPARVGHKVRLQRPRGERDRPAWRRVRVAAIGRPGLRRGGRRRRRRGRVGRPRADKSRRRDLGGKGRRSGAEQRGNDGEAAHLGTIRRVSSLRKEETRRRDEQRAKMDR